MFRVVLFAVLISFAVSLNAQERDGTTVVEKQGIALIKAQSWSSPAEAELVKFSAFTDRTARGSAAAGYFVFRLPSGNETQVPVARIVKMVLKPELPKELLDDSQRQSLQQQINEIASISTAFPATRIPLKDYAKLLQDAAARYDSGEVMEEGIWLSRKKYTDLAAKKIEARLRMAMIDSNSKKDFDLRSNSDFKKLGKLAESNPTVAARVALLQADYSKLLVRENQEGILAKLQDPLSPADADKIIKQLSEVSEKSPRTISVLNQAISAEGISKDVETVRLELEGLWNPEDLKQGKLPRLSDDLASRIDALMGRLKVFRAGLPPAGIWVPTAVLNYSVVLKNALPVVQEELDARNFRRAIEMLNNLSESARLLGPKTESALEVMKDYSYAQISKFSTLVEEANILLTNGDKKQAVTKFQEALNVMPDPGIESRLSEIK